MAFLDIHLESIDRKSFSGGNVLRRLMDLYHHEVPVVLSLPPWMEDYWKKENPAVIEVVKTLVKRPGSFLGQQGNMHKCKYDHTVADPWHENSCFYNAPLSKEEQGRLMWEGKERLEKLIGEKPALYVAPNHQFDETTLDVAENLGYRYFADLKLLPVKPYYHGSMLVVPEAPIKKGMTSFGNYIHYDEIDRHFKNFSNAVIMATPLSMLKGESSPDILWTPNRALKNSYKLARDAKRLLSGRNGSH